MDAYDVIIIGTGAGGGTLAPHLATNGKRILLLERGDWLTREPENWDAAGRVRRQPLLSPDTWYDGGGKAFSRRSTLRRRRDEAYGAALYRLRKEDFGELQPPRRHLARLADPLRGPRAVLHAGRLDGARRRGEDPTEPPASAPYPYPPVSHEPRIQQLVDDLRPPASAVPRSVRRSCSTSRIRRSGPASAVPPATASPAWSTRSQTPRCSACVPRSSTPNVTLLTNREAVEARHQRRPAPPVTEVVVDHDGAEERYSADVVVVAAGAANSAKLLLPSANDKHPNGLANGSDQVGRNYMFHDSTPPPWPSRATRTRPPTRRRSGSTTSTSAPTTSSSRSGTSRWSASRRRRCSAARDRRETKLAPEWTLERYGQARDRLLALDRGPASARQPGGGER